MVAASVTYVCPHCRKRPYITPLAHQMGHHLIRCHNYRPSEAAMTAADMQRRAAEGAERPVNDARNDGDPRAGGACGLCGVLHDGGVQCDGEP